MLSSETASLEEVAASIGKSPAWLQRHWLSFHRRTGFPRRLPGAWVWPRRAVEQFLRSGGQAAPRIPETAANQNSDNTDLIDQASAALLERYGARQ